VTKPPTQTPEQLAEHYEVERDLARRLRDTRDAATRRDLYATVYDELFRRVPHHPMLVARPDPAAHAARIAKQVALLRPLLGPDGAFLEVGAGDCSLSLALAPYARQVYAVDVSAEITKDRERPAHFTLALSDGTSIPVPGGSVTLAFSNQLMEHLHPDDAVAQLRAIAAALAPGGAYVCITPHRYSGPHDVSRAFDPVAQGLHLHEYRVGELVRLFRAAGFARFATYLPIGGRPRVLPLAAARLPELVLSVLPWPLRRRIARTRAVEGLLGIRLIAWKGSA
jgi:SAM-dependent methyltransferase